MAKQRKKSISTLSKLSGIPEKKLKELWKGVKENNALLSSCPLHEFESHSSPHMSRRFMCKNCKGIVGAIEMIWYEKGLSHDSPSHRYKKEDY
jgi:hypothetical protein